MERKNIADILNKSYGVDTSKDGITENDVLKADLSNIVDFGRKFVQGDDVAKKFSTLSGIIDKIRTTIYEDAEFIGTAPPCFKTNDDFRGLKEILHVEVGDFSENLTFDVDNTPTHNSFDALFGKELPEISAKYFGKCVHYAQKFTRTLNQFDEIFKSPENAVSFFTHVENAIRVKYDYSLDKLQIFTFNEAMLSCAVNNSNCITNLNANATTTDIVLKIKEIIRDLKAFNKKYTAFATSTTMDNIHIAIRGDVYDKIITSYANVYNPKFLEIPIENIHVMPYFQFASAPDTVKGTLEDTTANSTDNITKVAFVIYDARAFGCTSYNEVIQSQPVANEYGVTNYFHLAEMEWIVNNDLPVITVCENGGGLTRNVEII